VYIFQANSSFGKLRLRYLKKDDVNGAIEFLKNNCDIIEPSGRKADDHLVDKSLIWNQIGINYQTWKNKIEQGLNIRYIIYIHFIKLVLPFE